MDAILNRRSIRKYLDKKVEKEKIEALLKAAMQAPSAANQQPWEFIVVEKKETLAELSKTSQYFSKVADAPLAIVFVSRKDGVFFPEWISQDMSAAVENLLLQAADSGLGAVWLGVFPVAERMNHIKNLFNLPDNIEPFALIPIGYPDGQKNEFVDRFDATRIHNERWK